VRDGNLKHGSARERTKTIELFYLQSIGVGRLDLEFVWSIPLL
jgi:hypothetical protein